MPDVEKDAAYRCSQEPHLGREFYGDGGCGECGYRPKGDEPTPCRFGYTEYDGARYCHEHGDFLEPGVPSRRCTTTRVLPPAGRAS